MREKGGATMDEPEITVLFATEAGSQTLADYLEQLLSNLNLEGQGETT